MPPQQRFRVGAVSYLNTVPLVWGMLHGPQRDEVELSFSIPSLCAEQVERGSVDIGVVPVAEIARQELEIVPGHGIACFGAVRSILLFSRVPWAKIQTLSADLSSRTSVQLARVILRERYGAEPAFAPCEPELERMLCDADAALIIGDPALRLNPEELPFQYLDLGAEWLKLTGLPMVFAAWAGKRGLPLHELERLTSASYEFGRARLSEIVEQASVEHGVSRALAERYLRQHIRYELGAKEQDGLQAFLRLANLNKRTARSAGVVRDSKTVTAERA
ncbi:MAG TPA: menaquinone biosynthesis protein [Bryobacteraceae bacterium]|nr:menaquinone biosynthesis protein [Bryobacteraceae bacterium]